jgi:hypothetical protein
MASVPKPWRDRHSSSLTIQIALGLCNLARRPLAALGVDEKQLRTILAHRLSLDLNPRFHGEGADPSLGLVLSCVAVWLAGLGPGVVALTAKRPDLWLGLGQGMTLGIGLMFLFTQYGTLIVDPTDVRVISPLPVSDRTLFASRFGHALYYVGILSACASFFPAVLGAIVFPPWWALTLYPLSTFLTGFTALAGISALYALVLRFAGPARFQRLGMWVQIAGTSAVIGGMQVAPRFVVDRLADKSVAELAWLRWVLPPLHQLGLYETCALGPTAERLALAALAFAVPLLGLALALSLASRHFVAALTTREVESARRSHPWRAGWFSRLGARIARTRAERAGYDFALALSRREKTFLRVTVPQIVMFGAMGAGSLRADAHLGLWITRFFEHWAATMTALFGPVAILSTMSENFDARWVLRASPVAEWPAVGVAALRALFVGFVLPAMLAILALDCALTGGARAASLVLALELALLISLLASSRLRPPFPFSEAPRVQSGSVRDIPVVVAAVVATVPAAALAAAASYRTWIALACAFALVPACVVAWRRLARVRFWTLPS